jgi:hypothetical protein
VVRHNRIAIDTGAVFGGKMTCLVLKAARWASSPPTRWVSRVDRASVAGALRHYW